MATEIRRAAAGDVEALVGLHREVHALHLAERPDQFKPTSDEEIAGVYRTRLSAANTKVWVAVLDGTVVGHVVAIHHRRAEHAMCPARQWWDVDELGVTAAHRRSGIARALLQTVVDSATAAGIDEIELNSWAFNHMATLRSKTSASPPKSSASNSSADAFIPGQWLHRRRSLAEPHVASPGRGERAPRAAAGLLASCRGPAR